MAEETSDILLKEAIGVESGGGGVLFDLLLEVVPDVLSEGREVRLVDLTILDESGLILTEGNGLVAVVGGGGSGGGGKAEVKFGLIGGSAVLPCESETLVESLADARQVAVGHDAEQTARGAATEGVLVDGVDRLNGQAEFSLLRDGLGDE